MLEQMANDPEMRSNRAKLETFTRNFESNSKDGSSNEIRLIPVYVHVLYKTVDENISDDQIESQISVLNEDFGGTNSDISNVPSEFTSVTADDMQVQFELISIDRKYVNKTEWGTSNDMKYSSQGGIDAVTPDTHMNMWICNIGGGIMGYAQFPGGQLVTDGVVFSPQYCGSSDYGANFYLDPNNDKGRTATHEVGHYLNLYHIWGDGDCSASDEVNDTPSAEAPNYSCPTHPSSSCGSNDMFMNYMDYVVDECMFMFTEGQKTRSWAALNSSRANLGTTISPSGNDFLTFNIDGQSSSDINTTDHTVSVLVPTGTNLADLNATFTFSENATVSGEHTDFSNSVTYDITAEDGTVQTWTVTVEISNIIFSEDFENDVTANGWSLYDQDNDENNWEISTYQPHSGNSCYNSISDGLNPDNYLVSPPITLGTGASELKYFIKNFDPNFLDTYSVSISTNGTNFTSIDTETPAANWNEKTLDISSYAGQQIFIAFRHHDSYNQNKIFLDDVTVTSEAPTVSAANDFLTFNIDGQSSSNINTTDHTVSVLVPTGTNLADLNATFTFSENATVSGEHTDFSNSVTYDITAENGTVQTWTVNVEISNIIFSEDFENDVTTNGWELIDEDGDGSNWVITTETPHSGNSCYASHSFDESSFGTGDNDDADNYLISPQITIGTGTSELKYFIRSRVSTTILAATYSVLISNDGGTNFTSIYTETPTNTNWDEKTLDISSYAGQQINIAFRQHSSQKFIVYLDDVTVTSEAPTASAANDFLTFNIEGQISSNINTTDHTVSVLVPAGTNLANLNATFTFSENATVSGEHTDFSNSVTYDITAEDGSTVQTWTVTVTEASSSEIVEISIEDVSACVNNEVEIPVNMTGNNIGAFDITISYDPSKLTYMSYKNLNNNIPNVQISSGSNTGEVLISSASLPPISLNNEKLFDLKFEYTSEESTELTIAANEISVLDENNQYILDNVELNLTNGNITPKTLPTASLNGDVVLCENEEAEIVINFADGDAPFSVSYTYNDIISEMSNIMDNSYTLLVDEAGTFQLNSVNDATCNNDATDNIEITAVDKPTAIFAEDNNTNVINQGETSELIVNFTGTIPFSLTYNNGAENLLIEDIQENTYTLNVTPSEITTYSIVAIQDGNCLNEDINSQTTVDILIASSISGRIVYNNGLNSAVENVTVNLVNADNDNIVASVTTGNDGLYNFQAQAGNYKINATKENEWAGANATDALILARHAVNLLTGNDILTNFQIKVSDVNVNSNVNSTDALIIMMRSINYINEFSAVGDWAFESKTITVVENEDIVYLDLNASCYGDVNASNPNYNNTKRVENKINMVQSEILEIENSNLNIQIKSLDEINIGAMSLTIEYPNDIVEVKSVNSKILEGLKYNIIDNKINIVWYDINSLDISENETLINLELSKINDGEIYLNISNDSEFADENAKVLKNVVLSAPSVNLNSTNSELLLNNYPNPFNNETIIEYNLVEDSKVQLTVYDITSREIVKLVNENQTKGLHKQKFESKELDNGIYFYEIKIKSENFDFIKINKMILRK